MKLIFVRHGDPDYDRDSLTEKGFREANILSHKLKDLDVTEFFVSTMGRANDTSRDTLAAQGRTARVCDFLEELPARIIDPVSKNRTVCWYMFPSYINDNEEIFFGRDTWYEHPVMRAAKAKEYYDRLTNGVDGILKEYGYTRDGDIYRCDDNKEQTLVFFCHMGTTLSLISYFLGVSPVAVWHSVYLAPTSLTVFQSEEREKGIVKFRAQVIGDTSHLYHEGEPPSHRSGFPETYEKTEVRHRAPEEYVKSRK